ILGQLASAHTVFKEVLATWLRKFWYSGPTVARVLSHSGRGSRGTSAWRASIRSSLRPSACGMVDIDVSFSRDWGKKWFKTVFKCGDEWLSHGGQCGVNAFFSHRGDRGVGNSARNDPGNRGRRVGVIVQ